MAYDFSGKKTASVKGLSLLGHKVYAIDPSE
jgi:hypothetical protein